MHQDSQKKEQKVLDHLDMDNIEASAVSYQMNKSDQVQLPADASPCEPQPETQIQ